MNTPKDQKRQITRGKRDKQIEDKVVKNSTHQNDNDQQWCSNIA
jgi:hypothetical protein